MDEHYFKTSYLYSSIWRHISKDTEIYIRGNTIKYIRVPEDVIVKIRDEQYTTRKSHDSKRGGFRGSSRTGNAQRGGQGQRGGRGSNKGKNKN